MGIEVHSQALPPGSHHVYVIVDGEYGDPIDTVGVFVPFRDGTELRGVHGELNADINIMLAIEARKLGYDALYFRTPAGSERVSRLSEEVGELDGMRLHKVDLAAFDVLDRSRLQAMPAPSPRLRLVR